MVYVREIIPKWPYFADQPAPVGSAVRPAARGGSAWMHLTREQLNMLSRLARSLKFEEILIEANCQKLRDMVGQQFVNFAELTHHT